MSRLTVELYDAIGDVNPFLIITDDVPFVDLNDRNGADKAARVVVKRGSEYHPGDHVRLLDEVQLVDTDMITVDPLVAADVDLNAMGFADRAAGLAFELNPGASFDARVELFDTPRQALPNLSLYDWQSPSGFYDLNSLHFADKAAAVRVVGSRSHIITPIPPIPSQAAPPIRSGP